MITLKEQVAKFGKWTPFIEMHGDVPVPGFTLPFTFNVESKTLAGFHDELRGLLYHKHGARSKNLADQTAELPDIRLERINYPLKWRQKYEGSTLTVHIGDVPEHTVVLHGKVNKPFEITPMQGGTVVITMRFNCHPKGEQTDTLNQLQKNDCRISFDPGKEVADDGADDDNGDDKGDE